MGEAILVKTGGGGTNEDYDPNDKYITSWQLKTEIINASKEYTIPKAKNQEFAIRLFGSGAGANWGTNIARTSINAYGFLPGASGNMNYGNFKIKRGEIVSVIVGIGGRANENGSTTSFGNYLSATGGECADALNNKGGNGGVGTPPLAVMYSVETKNFYDGTYTFYNVYGMMNGGKSAFGGGCGGILSRICNGSINTWSGTSEYNNDARYTIKKIDGTNGGIYGGGGGTPNGFACKTGGNNCGNGGNNSVQSQKGKNTIGMILDFNGYGEVSANSYFGGGGGYGGNGGNAVKYGSRDSTSFGYYETYDATIICCGGGGGYGAAGYYYPLSSTLYSQQFSNGLKYITGGVGGGYGGVCGSYGSGGYGQGGLLGQSMLTGKNGIAIITYYAPIYNG